MALKFILFIAAVLSVLLGLHLLLYCAVVRFFIISNTVLRSALFIVLSLLSFSFVAAFFLLHWRENWFTVNFYLLAAVWTGFLINLLLASGLTWLFDLTGTLSGHSPKTSLVAGGLFILALFYSVYGIWNAFHPRIKNIEVKIAGLPEEWKNKKIVQLSDIHLGHIYGRKFLERIVDKVNGCGPDLVFITGDLFDGMSKNPYPLSQTLNTLNAGRGIFFITGNHENYVGVHRSLEILKKTKVIVLHDEMRNIGGLYIIGISYPGITKIGDIRNIGSIQKKHSINKPRILLFHTPTNIDLKQKDAFGRHFSTYWVPDTSFAMSKQLGIDLQLSGHTHKGQIFPFDLLTKYIYHGYDYGLHTEGDFSIYTTSGVGTWGPPMRTGTSPEIVVIRLK